MARAVKFTLIGYGRSHEKLFGYWSDGVYWLCNLVRDGGNRVLCMERGEGRKFGLGKRILALDELRSNSNEIVGALPKFSSVIFSQGVNAADSADSFDKRLHREVYDANVMVILESVNALLINGLLHNPSSICIVSSVWQELARNDKLSYSVSKAALRGVVLSLVADLSKYGVKVNAVLPGPIDNEMTQSNLTNAQLQKFKEESPTGNLALLDSVVDAVAWLADPSTGCITGNFINIDSGASRVRLY